VKSAANIRKKLDACGARRKAHEKEGKEIETETSKLLGEAKAHPDISVTEAAGRVRLHRTTVYRVYT
jgi:hypothetical protein